MSTNSFHEFLKTELLKVFCHNLRTNAKNRLPAKYTDEEACSMYKRTVAGFISGLINNPKRKQSIISDFVRSMCKNYRDTVAHIVELDEFMVLLLSQFIPKEFLKGFKDDRIASFVSMIVEYLLRSTAATICREEYVKNIVFNKGQQTTDTILMIRQTLQEFINDKINELSTQFYMSEKLVEGQELKTVPLDVSNKLLATLKTKLKDAQKIIDKLQSENKKLKQDNAKFVQVIKKLMHEVKLIKNTTPKIPQPKPKIDKKIDILDQGLVIDVPKKVTVTPTLKPQPIPEPAEEELEEEEEIEYEEEEEIEYEEVEEGEELEEGEEYEYIEITDDEQEGNQSTQGEEKSNSNDDEEMAVW